MMQINGDAMTDHFQDIYANHADQYEALVAREDYEGNILKALQSVRPLDGLDVVEFGAGTGRVTLLLAPLAKSITVFDGSQAMLNLAIGKLQQSGLTNWRAEVADNRSIPVSDASADLAIEGWSFGHLRGWYPDSWREEAFKALAEMKRTLRLGGTAILMETLGTGRETPQPPTPQLAEFYSWLENEQGFTRIAIRTDYRFESLAEAEQLTRFFFGDDLAKTVVERNWVVLPECTGVWWRMF